MTERIEADLCIIGAGSGGLAAAAGAAMMGARVVLIEKGKMGGDCLNYGCVPSKSLIAAAKHAKAMTSGTPFGIAPVTPSVDFGKVHEHVHDVIASIAPHDSVERFEELGVRVVQAAGWFVSGQEVEAGAYRVRARRFIVATGSSAAVPPIPGLEGTPYLTNETIFDNQILPRHLIVIGGGPIGLEMAQAHRRLGSEVTVLEKFNFFAKDDPELAAIVLDSMRDDGVSLQAGVDIDNIAYRDGAFAISITRNGEKSTVEGSHLLVAAGRKANVEGLGLEAGGIEYDRRGIKVTRGLRTSNRRVFAIGDVAGALQFTHIAGYHAGLVLRNALFPLAAFGFEAKVDHDLAPWVTFTDPELAHVGLTEEATREKHGNVRVLRWSFEENDRAQAERRTKGLVKVVTTGKGVIVGATIVNGQAGELIQPWVLAVSQKMKIGAMAQMIAPYPTLGEASKRAAGAYYTPLLFSARMKRMVRFFARLP